MKTTVVRYKKGIEFNLFGDTSVAQLTELTGQSHGDQSLDDFKFHLWDLSKASLTSIDEDDIVEIAAIDLAASMSCPRLTIIAIADHPHTVKLLRKYSSYLSQEKCPWKIELFGKKEAAYEWLRMTLGTL